MDVHLAPVSADFVALGCLNVHCEAPVAAAGHGSRVGVPRRPPTRLGPGGALSERPEREHLLH
ncbi:hypothetical protein STRIP9103_07298 [Streptomyces ipomoeae 91-03]|uniref:Uncharacterized protein n=1 Tax=Streptomyces ipomoeae 91-03 TaxID=698759 RepID=L1L2Q3_9ACTN|nr:hypothetical protein STRIP9103_07298 [Streptomyces ipomoeae 91-03]